MEVLFDVKVNSNGNTSHTINSGREGKCSRTNTPRKGRNAECIEEIGGRRQQFNRVFVGGTGGHRGSRGLGTIRGAVIDYSEETVKPVVSLDHDYEEQHQGRLMYSGDPKVSVTKKTEIIRAVSEKSHRFRGVHPSGKSPMVSPVKEDAKRSDIPDRVMYYKSKGNHKVSCSSQTAPIQMDVNRKRSTGGVYSNICPDQYVPLRSARGVCKGSESQEEERFRCVVPEDTTKNKIFPREKRQISDRKTGMSHIEPSTKHQPKEKTIDRIDVNEMEVTGCDYNERVPPHSTEQFYGTPIRYTFANGRRLGWKELTPGREGVKRNNQSGRWMSSSTVGNDHSHRTGYYSGPSRTTSRKGQPREGDWVSRKGTKLDGVDHMMASGYDIRPFWKDTPSLAEVDTVTHTTTKRTVEPRSEHVWDNRGVNNSRLVHTKGSKEESREGDWVSGNGVKNNSTDHMMAGSYNNKNSLRSTPSFAEVDTATQTTTERTMEPRSENVWGHRGVRKSGQYKSPQLVKRTSSVDDIIDWIEVYPEVESEGSDIIRYDTNGTTTRIEPRKDMVNKELIKPITFISRPDTRGKLHPQQQPNDESLKRTSVSVLREVLGCNEPRWMKLNTDRIRCNQASVEVTKPPKFSKSTTAGKGQWTTRERKLNPKAQSFAPSQSTYRAGECMTMTAELDNGNIGGTGGVGEIQQSIDLKNDPKGATEEAPLVWNLKGRSIDDILRDLDALKNDPDIPMPIIEADLAPAEDFEQYTRSLPKEESGNDAEDEDELSKDSDCLETLQQLTGPGLEEYRPQAFPKDLWPYVFNNQKTLVKERWAGYDEDKLPMLIDDFLTELKVSEERPYAKPYFLAQALANMDRFVIKSKVGIPPLIDEKFTHKMELLSGTRVRKELPQRFSENQNAFLKAKLSILEEQGRIKQKDGLKKDDWLHRLVLVENPTRMAAFRLKHGDLAQQAMNDPANKYEVSQLYRLTIDCREINKCLVVEPYPMPENSMGKEHIIDSRYMSTSDAADAFYAVPIRDIDYGKTGFTALGKQWVFTVMLQGGINSARHFARIITETFDGVPQSKILAFQDDALVHAKRLLQALLNQQLLYDCIRSNEIMLKPSKTRIGFSSCKFLGHIYTPMGRLPDPGRVESIINMDAKPKTQKEVRHIVGLLVWNIEYIPNGMSILSYLSDLVRKDADVVTGWKPEVQGKALDLLKAALASAPCLRPIDIKRPFRVHVDACKNGRGIGAVLLQEYNNKWRPCSYFSRALTPAQRQWSATELEAYALVSAARHWERYLQNGHKWTAIVDHKALIYLVVKRTRTNNTRLLNSVMCLQGHHFDILHRNGEEHFDADAVSRILHSGDIQEAQEAVDIENDDDKAVTMKDIYLLNRLLQLQLLSVANARGDAVAHMPMNPDVKGGPEKQVALVKKYTRKVSKALETDDESSPVTLETNMALTDDESSERKSSRKELGLIEAQEKAKQARERLRQIQLEQSQMVVNRLSSSSSSDHRRQVEEVRDEDNNNHLDEDASSPREDSDIDDNSNEDEKSSEPDVNYSRDPRALIRSGPFRWTPAVIKEFMAEYRHLEGKLLLHPRTGRLYEVNTVFFYDKLKIAAAYIRSADGGQADPLDEHPHRIDGRGGLAELVEKFSISGGSSGSSRTPWPSSESEWLIEQKKDPQWQEVIEELEREYLSQRINTQQPSSSSSSGSSSMLSNDNPVEEELTPVEKRYKGVHLIFDGVLMVKQPTYDDEEYRTLYIVPDSLKRNVIELHHDSKGHPGAARTKETIHLYYWWKGMIAAVTEHVNSCKACARRKARNAVAATPIQGYSAPRMPWERVHMDLTGPLTESKNGNKYILVVKDALTRYVEAIAIKGKSAEEVVHAFIIAIVYRHGAVGWLISDNGREFVNKLFIQVAQLLNIKHSTITAYNPRANGLAENHMRTMKDALSIYCDETQKDWDEHLGGVTMSYNTTVNSQTGFTPYFMLYGREARMPSDMWMRGFKRTSDILQYMVNVVKALSVVWESTAALKPAELKRMQDGQKPARHLQFAEYKVGDYAMVVNTPKSQNLSWSDAKFRKLNLKLQPRFSGPYLISRQISPVVYVLKVDGFDMKVHATNMKPFMGRKTTLTPYAEPGFDRYEANERVAPKPLLLSPDMNLNEDARVRFKKRSLGRQRQHTEAVNANEDRSRRDTEIRESISASQNEDWIVEDDLHWEKSADENSVLPNEESDNEDEEEESLKENGSHSDSNPTHSNSSADRTTSSSTTMSTEVTEVETNMLHIEGQNEPSVVCWEEDFQERARKISSNWENAMGMKIRRSRKRILDVAKISEIDLELDPHMKERIEIWIEDITMNEQSRCSRLSKSQLRKESMITSIEERIGMQLQGRELQWQGRHKVQQRTACPQTSENQFCGLSEVITPFKTEPIPSSSNLPDHIPESLTSSQITMDNESQVLIEECNLLNVEIWNTPEEKETQQASEDMEDEEMSMSSEDSFDREKWHRSVLKACTQHASKLNLSIYEPISFVFEKQESQKLRVELDAEIPIPTSYRNIWYQIQNDIRRFNMLGLLFPVINHSLDPTDHWRNNSKQNYRCIPQSIYLRVLSVPVSILKTLFPSDYKGKVTMITETPNLNSRMIKDTVSIHQKYDLWYWKAMRMARRMDVDPSSPRRAYNRLRGHSRKEAHSMNAPEWRAHHYYMWEAIQRNKFLHEPPTAVMEEIARC